jgi:hypothetical protein
MADSYQKYIIRTEKAGVFYAGLKERRGNEADLVDARRIWNWNGATECLQIALEGVAPSSRITVKVPSLTVLGVTEIIPCSEKAGAAIDGVEEWRA